MSTNFPVSLDDGTSLPNPSANSAPNSPSHSSLHSNANDSIKAVEAKVGTGASTPTSNTFFIGNGSGTSAWSGLTSAQLAARLSDETGSGAVVFANTPTLITPKVDTINEATADNGVTIDGVSLKDSNVSASNVTASGNVTVTGTTTSTGAVSTAGTVSVRTGTAPPAGGATTSGVKLSSTANLGIFWGSGAPTLSAAQGSIYIRTDGSSTSTRLYVNTTGSTTWTNFTSAA